jgi:hypothetical protein
VHTSFSYPLYCKELKRTLINSTFVERNIIANFIIDENLDLVIILHELKSDKKILLRYLWLLSEIAALKPSYFLGILPSLKPAILQLEYKYHSALASLWLIAGVPEENEADAIDLLYNFINDSVTNPSVKFRAILCLASLAQKHPELKNELKSCIEYQLHKQSPNFKKRTEKVLDELGLEK